MSCPARASFRDSRESAITSCVRRRPTRCQSVLAFEPLPHHQATPSRSASCPHCRLRASIERQASGLARMTFPAYRHLLTLEPVPRLPDEGDVRPVQPIAIGARHDDAIVGLALAEVPLVRGNGIRDAALGVRGRGVPPPGNRHRTRPVRRSRSGPPRPRASGCGVHDRPSSRRGARGAAGAARLVRSGDPGDDDACDAGRAAPDAVVRTRPAAGAGLRDLPVDRVDARREAPARDESARAAVDDGRARAVAPRSRRLRRGLERRASASRRGRGVGDQSSPRRRRRALLGSVRP